MDSPFPSTIKVRMMSEESILQILKVYDDNTPNTPGFITTVELGMRYGKPYLGVSKVHSTHIEKGMGIMGRRPGAVSSSVWWVSTSTEVEIYKPSVIGVLIAIRRTEPEREEMVFYSYRDWMICFGKCLIGGDDIASSEDEYLSDSLSEKEDEDSDVDIEGE